MEATQPTTRHEDFCGPYPDFLNARLATEAFTSKGERTRYRLRVAAAKALEEGGYQNLKVANVCTLADVAMGTFYVYFRDKAEIATDVVLSFIDHLYLGARAVARGTSDYESIYNTNLFFVRAYRANAGLMRCLVQLQSDEPEFREQSQPRHRKWMETLARSIRKRSSDPSMSDQRSLKVASALEGMVFNYLYAAAVSQQSLIESPDGNDEEIAEILSTLWYRGVHGRDPVVASAL